MNDGDNSRLQLGYERRVSRGDSVLSVLSGEHDLVDLLVQVDGLVRRGQVQGHRGLWRRGGSLGHHDPAHRVQAARCERESGQHGWMDGA